MTALREAAKAALWAFQCHVEMTWPTDRSTAAIAALRAALAQEQAEPDAYPYASRLAASIWERHYKGEAPNWKPLDDLMGVLTQIDNMATGLTRQGQEQADPVAWLYEAGTDRTLHWQEPPLYGTPLYTTPPQRQPLTEPDLSRCPQCNGPADNGHDRSIPPNPYLCTKCMAEPVAGIIESEIKVDSHQTIDEAMRLPRAMAQAYENGYKAGVAAEREACAQACEARFMGDMTREDMEARRCAAAIRARGEQP